VISRIFRVEALVARRANSVKKACLAQGLAEYAIAGTCLGLVCMVGLGLFSSQLGELLSGFRSQLVIPAGGGEVTASTSGPTGKTPTTQTEGQSVIITLPDGSQMVLDHLSMAPGELIETLGANGYTHAMANNIKDTASKLKRPRGD
jgi:hypothetical protein